MTEFSMPAVQIEDGEDHLQQMLDALDDQELELQRKMTARVAELEHADVDSMVAAQTAQIEFGDYMQAIKQKRATLLEAQAQASELGSSKQ